MSSSSFTKRVDVCCAKGVLAPHLGQRLCGNPDTAVGTGVVCLGKGTSAELWEQENRGREKGREIEESGGQREKGKKGALSGDILPSVKFCKSIRQQSTHSHSSIIPKLHIAHPQVHVSNRIDSKHWRGSAAMYLHGVQCHMNFSPVARTQMGPLCPLSFLPLQGKHHGEGRGVGGGEEGGRGRAKGQEEENCIILTILLKSVY